MQTSNKTIARITGGLFLIPLVAYGFGSALIASVTGQADHLVTTGEAHTPLITGCLLLVVNSVTVVAIAVMLFPVLEQESRRTAVWYLSTRIMEAVILVVGLISVLLLLTLSADYTKTSVADPAVFDTLYNMAHRSNYWAYQIAMIVLGLGSLPFCRLLFNRRMVPAPLSLLGIVGYALLALGAVFELYGYKIGVLLSIPGGLFEIGFGIWLMVKGFKK